ncbi:centrosomal protein of 41 kDa isoform X2 [Scleropages formosus]|uniref:centrosomal protein of 41 kDa isoform X2 n=1 Tax=Scleropages formosus TaxID=113540 RepID=UPI000878D83F|nr:centrosomal protein of 41 kDa isoform X2 [Scleropages formosus]
MSTNRGLGSAEYLKKRIPQNPKYQHVKSRLDTGCSRTKYLERLEEIKRNYRYKKGELFRRLKVSTFAQLVIQVASVSDLNGSLSNGETQTINDDAALSPELASDTVKEGSDGSSQMPVQLVSNNNSGAINSTPRSTLQSVISGVGELDLDKNEENSTSVTPLPSPRSGDQPYSDCPYLLLDVRDRDKYDQCHIITYSYPIATLSRTMNPYTKEVLDYKNAPGKIIIVYDEDERIASQAATTMCERGFENLFMLSGGLKVVAQKFPEGMTTGSIPAQCLPSPPGSGGRKRPTVPRVSHPAEKKWRFTSEDLGKIQFHLEEMVMSTTSSSQGSRTQSIASSARSWQTPSVAGSDSTMSQSSRPWK